MNDLPGASPHEEGTTTLHLNKFAPGRAENPSSEDSSLTVVIQKAAVEAMQKGEQSAHPVVAPKDSLPPKEMLGAVTYCYAKGVYESERIEEKMLKDPALREQLHDHVPDADSIRRFRKMNREAIISTLTKAFRWKRRKAAAETVKETLPGAEPARPPTTLSEDGETRTTVVSREDAQRRLDDAAWVDNMSRNRD